MDTAPTFPAKSVAFETIKSTGLGFMGGFGLFYALIKGIERIGTGGWNFPYSQAVNVGISAGTLFAALHGYDKYKLTQIHNDRADLLNKYQSIPDIQRDILTTTGLPQNYQYRRPMVERTFSSLLNLSVWAWLASGLLPVNRTFANTLGTTTSLCGTLWVLSHLVGIHYAEKTERQNLSHTEKLALEKAAARLDIGKTA